MNSFPDANSLHRRLIVLGTRPEALKCFPIAQAAQACTDCVAEICVTAQHAEKIIVTGNTVIDTRGLWTWRKARKPDAWIDLVA